MYRKESLERNLPLHVDYSEVLENPMPAGRVIPGSVIGDKIGKKVVEPLVFSVLHLVGYYCSPHPNKALIICQVK